MNKKSFFIGFGVGVVVTIVVLFIIGVAMRNNEETDPIEYLEQPVSYEHKKEASFKVLQVLGNAALATEHSEDDMYLGNTVVIIGDNYYSDQIVTIKNPQRIGTYSYTNNGGMPMTVPVLDGDISTK